MIGTPLNLDSPRKIQNVAFSPDGKTILAGSADGAARIWDIATQRILANLAGLGEHIGSDGAFALSNAGHFVVSSNDKDVLVWDATAAKLVRTLTDHQNAVRMANFSPDGRVLATYDRDGAAVFWSWETGQVLGRFKPFGDQKETFIMDGVTFEPSG